MSDSLKTQRLPDRPGGRTKVVRIDRRCDRSPLYGERTVHPRSLIEGDVVSCCAALLDRRGTGVPWGRMGVGLLDGRRANCCVSTGAKSEAATEFPIHPTSRSTPRRLIPRWAASENTAAGRPIRTLKAPPTRCDQPGRGWMRGWMERGSQGRRSRRPRMRARQRSSAKLRPTRGCHVGDAVLRKILR